LACVAGATASKRQKKQNAPNSEIVGTKMLWVRAFDVGADVKPKPNIMFDAIILCRGFATFLTESSYT
jgi:hypothetical protein